jgi:hypothetical protein
MSCELVHREHQLEHPGQTVVMAAPSFGHQPNSEPSQWYTSSTCNQSYLMAALRAGVIALILLGILALIVWF